MITNLTVSAETLESLEKYRLDSGSELNWDLVFTLPEWLRAWWGCFGAGAELFIRSFKQDGQLLGIAPLQVRDGKASIIGNIDVCDYQDFITVPGMEREFFQALMNDLRHHGIRELLLETVRPDSAVVLHLLPLVMELGLPVDHRQVDVSLDMELPGNWEDYLKILNGKQRHEIRRKMRNLNEAGNISYHVIESPEALRESTPVFLRLFPDYRQDKAEFLTEEMQVYFHSLAESLAGAGVLRYGVLEFSGQPVAMIMYFDYRNNFYLYNSAYHPDYRSLSVGIVSKAQCIRDGIEKRKKRFDFLKGNEKYKYHLGGKEIPLYRYSIIIG